METHVDTGRVSPGPWILSNRPSSTSPKTEVEDDTSTNPSSDQDHSTKSHTCFQARPETDATRKGELLELVHTVDFSNATFTNDVLRRINNRRYENFTSDVLRAWEAYYAAKQSYVSAEHNADGLREERLMTLVEVVDFTDSAFAKKIIRVIHNRTYEDQKAAALPAKRRFIPSAIFVPKHAGARALVPAATRSLSVGSSQLRGTDPPSTCYDRLAAYETPEAVEPDPQCSSRKKGVGKWSKAFEKLRVLKKKKKT